MSATEFSELLEFDAPPLVEVALSVQFGSLFGLRPIELGLLRDRWRAEYPVALEQPPVPAAIEADGAGVARLNFMVASAGQSQVRFLSTDQSSVVQLQHDRLTVNWRRSTPETPYPRYPAVRSTFESRATDLAGFITERDLGRLSVTQVEVTYINSIETAPENLGDISQILRNWEGPAPDLGQPEQASFSLVFSVPGLGRPPVRFYVAVNPARRPDGSPALFLTLTVRGAPTGGDLADALSFMDQAHAHIVRSFALLTPDAMHLQWKIVR